MQIILQLGLPMNNISLRVFYSRYTAHFFFFFAFPSCLDFEKKYILLTSSLF